MPRPTSVTNEDIARFSENIDNDPNMDPALAESPIIREVCYAGQWIHDKLTELHCDEVLIARIMYTAGALSFGRKDPWTVHQEILSKYLENELEYEDDA